MRNFEIFRTDQEYVFVERRVHRPRNPPQEQTDRKTSRQNRDIETEKETDRQIRDLPDPPRYSQGTDSLLPRIDITTYTTSAASSAAASVHIQTTANTTIRTDIT